MILYHFRPILTFLFFISLLLHHMERKFTMIYRTILDGRACKSSMRSSAGASFWQSRLKLATACASLAVLIVILDYKALSFEQNDLQIKARALEEDILGDYYADTFKAMEAIQYMRDLQTGKAFIRPVVEEESSVTELYWWCNPNPPEQIESAGWIEGADMQMFSAHYDRRENSLFPNNHAIQVLTMSRGSVENATKVYCTIFSGRKSAVVQGYIREIWQRAWDPRDAFYVPNLITCPVPNRLREAPKLHVSLGHIPCERAHQSLRVQTRKVVEKKSKVAVCVKGMDFQEDNSMRVLEWLEAQYLMGADTVTVYTYTVSPKTEKILRHYEAAGRLEEIPLTLPFNCPNQPYVRSGYIWRNRQLKRRFELIPYNDCLYRHIETHDYILIVDTDEWVVPLTHDSWTPMLEEVESHNPKRKISSISIRNLFKFPSNSPNDNFPEQLYMLRNQHRSRKVNKKGDYGKSFSSTAHVATVFNHFALHRLSRSVATSLSLPPEVALKLHYKEKCPIESKYECDELTNDVIIDNSTDRFSERLRVTVEDAKNRMGL